MVRSMAGKEVVQRVKCEMSRPESLISIIHEKKQDIMAPREMSMSQPLVAKDTSNKAFCWFTRSLIFKGEEKLKRFQPLTNTNSLPEFLLSNASNRKASCEKSSKRKVSRSESSPQVNKSFYERTMLTRSRSKTIISSESHDKKCESKDSKLKLLPRAFCVSKRSKESNKKQKLKLSPLCINPISLSAYDGNTAPVKNLLLESNMTDKQTFQSKGNWKQLEHMVKSGVFLTNRLSSEKSTCIFEDLEMLPPRERSCTVAVVGDIEEIKPAPITRSRSLTWGSDSITTKKDYWKMLQNRMKISSIGEPLVELTDISNYKQIDNESKKNYWKVLQNRVKSHRISSLVEQKNHIPPKEDENKKTSQKNYWKILQRHVNSVSFEENPQKVEKVVKIDCKTENVETISIKNESFVETQTASSQSSPVEEIKVFVSPVTNIARKISKQITKYNYDEKVYETAARVTQNVIVHRKSGAIGYVPHMCSEISKFLANTNRKKFLANKSSGCILRQAVRSFDKEALIKLLHVKMVDVNEANSKGITALHEAAIDGNFTCLEILVENGADVMATDKEGFSCLDYAVLGGNFDCATFLIEKGAATDHVKNGDLTINLSPP